jgi:CBS domain-containing protein
MLFMLENNIRRLPLTKHGQIIGVISVTDLLRHQTTNPFFVLSQLDKDPASLGRYTRQVTKIVANLFDGGLEIMQIARTIASMNDHLIKRLLSLTEEQLGPPPTPYAWLVFGSEGRQEQLLLTDQDNALVYQDDTPEAAQYFNKFSQTMVKYLIQAGFPSCPGGCMATNWHKPLAQWVALFRQWIEEPKAQALLEAGIFFDFRVAHGELDITPLLEVLQRAKESTLFLAHLTRAALEFTPPLGFFGRIIKDDDGRINLKKAGIAPIVGMARVYGLQSGTNSPATIDRLDAAVKANKLSQNGAELLAETFRFLLRLRLKEQLQAHKNGRTLDNNLKWDDLSPLDRRHAKDAFIAIREYQEHLSLHFNTNMLG